MKDGIYQIEAAAYHADAGPDAPALSASLAHLLISQSPKHAWTASPRLNPHYEPDLAEHFDVGTACHSLLLEGDVTNFVVIHARSFRMKDAQTQRDAARAEGKTPLLVEQWERVQAMAEAVHAQIKQVTEGPIPFTNGRAEETLVWTEPNGVRCRARLDWLHLGGLFIDDLKTVGGTANPAAWIKGPFFNHGCDVQAGWYRRGVRAVLGVEATFRFILAETAPPYAVAIVSPGPDVLTLAEKKCLFAIEQWARCLERNEWPSYTLRTHYAGLPPWIEAAWLEQEMQEEAR